MVKHILILHLFFLSCFMSISDTYAQLNPCQQITAYKIVVLGSSTAAGTGPSASDSSWVNKYRAHLQSININNEVINFAVGGYNTYRIMPTGFVPPPNRPNTDINRNITAALAESPDAIIINMPSNDVAAGYTYAEQMFNLDTIVDIALTNNIPIWVCTTQPRNFSNTSSLQLQADLKDSITSIFSPLSIDFWSVIANPNHTINPLYDSGDGVHLNDAGHAILTQRVIDTDILSAIPTPSNQVDYGIQSILIDGSIECGDSNTVIQVVMANYGIQDSVDGWVYLNNTYWGAGQNTIDSLIFPPPPSCTIDTFSFNLNTYDMGTYHILAHVESNNDANAQNDSLIQTIQTLGHPSVLSISDTLCMPGTGILINPTLQNDTSFWYQNINDSVPIYSGQNFTSPHINSTTTWYVETIRGDLFYRSNLETTTTSNINWNGAMFNLIPQEDIVLDSIGLKVHSTGMQSVDIYYKSGSYIGSENNPSDWNLMTTVSKMITDSLRLSYYPLPAFLLNSYDTIGIYVQMSNPQVRLSYQSVPNPVSRFNSELTIITGTGISHNFVGNYFPRDLNCDIRYHYGSRNGGACSTGKIPTTIYMSDFELTIGNDTIIDIDDSLSLTVPIGLFDWLWSSGDVDSSIIIRGAELGTGIHYISLSGYDSLGCLKTDERIVGVAELVGLEKYNDALFDVFPNPSQDYFFSNIEGNYTVDVFNQAGQKVITNGQFPIDVRLFSSGILHLMVTDELQNTYYIKVMKR